MCPNCKQNTFSAWDKVTSTKPRVCEGCGVVVKPAFYRSALSLLIATFLSPICTVLLVDVVMKQTAPISFTYIWLIGIVFIVGALLPILPLIKINDLFVPWVIQKT